MNFKTINPDQSISLFVKSILVFEELEKNQKTVLPFFADGFHVLVFQETENGLFLSPHNKKMSSLFVCGQTIKPIELHVEGCYKLIIFQLYPFTLKSFFNLTAKEINEDCYDLQQLENVAGTVETLLQNNKLELRIQTITNLLFDIFKAKKRP